MDYSKENFFSFFDLYKEGIHNKFGPVTHSEQEFQRRFKIFTGGLLDNFDYNNAFLCGGSLFAMLDPLIADEELSGNSNPSTSTLCSSDIDLFILRDGSIEDSLLKLKCVLQHFVAYANEKEKEILFIIRGLLIEVMIGNERRVQVLLTSYTTVESCLSFMSVIHLHMYFDGKALYASDAAIDNIMRKETKMCRAPIKDTKIGQLISRGITPVGEILTTKMDNDFHSVLKSLDAIKEKVDNGERVEDFPTCIHQRIQMKLYIVLPYWLEKNGKRKD